MAKLVDLTKQAQNSDTAAISIILERFEPKIKASLQQTPIQEQADLYQELRIKLIEMVREFDFNKTYNFTEFKQKQSEFKH
ncbi:MULTISPECIES: helix-turn-helix domain-containing protein [Virgibacillus]|uniref:RNA polymerase factor sigma-70 n=1 Tax=Virgibacillus massiliensis TaxID=1462526 RepID=A0A024QCU3_9BACI|nr:MULTISPECIES: helix-turn-helix domain-containing protein [Virgibacillus]EQB36629.1 hypothetical protein M948_16490 [Virgibacillus sp. CM-4]CDQ40329.1 RNA polymerase factor sigma-70 [Virgibacillus massiliensis]